MWDLNGRLILCRLKVGKLFMMCLLVWLDGCKCIICFFFVEGVFVWKKWKFFKK